MNTYFKNVQNLDEFRKQSKVIKSRKEDWAV